MIAYKWGHVQYLEITQLAGNFTKCHMLIGTCSFVQANMTDYVTLALEGSEK